MLPKMCYHHNIFPTANQDNDRYYYHRDYQYLLVIDGRRFTIWGLVLGETGKVSEILIGVEAGFARANSKLERHFTREFFLEFAYY